MMIRNRIIVKKSNLIIGSIAIVALIVLVLFNLFTEPKDLDKIPEWEEFYELGVTNYNMGSYQAAITYFKIAIDIDNTHPEAYILAADAYLQIDQVKKAREILKIGLDATGNEVISDKYEEVMAMPDPVEILPPPIDDDDEEHNDDDFTTENSIMPEEELKSSELTDVF